jgi:hypothetical protein
MNRRTIQEQAAEVARLEAKAQQERLKPTLNAEQLYFQISSPLSVARCELSNMRAEAQSVSNFSKGS